MTRKRAASLAERLAARQRPTVVVPLQVDDPAAARTALVEAQAAARQVLLRDGRDSAAHRRADAKVTAAQRQVDGCFAQITLQAMRPADYEALVAAHPPTPEQAAAEEIWNVDTFRPALLAACCPDMTADQWAEFLTENVSQGERDQLWLAALSVNQRARSADSVALPKGLTAMLSSLSS